MAAFRGKLTSDSHTCICYLLEYSLLLGLEQDLEKCLSISINESEDIYEAYLEMSITSMTRSYMSKEKTGI